MIEWIIGIRGQSMDCVHDYLDWINVNAFRCSSGGPCCQSFFLYFAWIAKESCDVREKNILNEWGGTTRKWRKKMNELPLYVWIVNELQVA